MDKSKKDKSIITFICVLLSIGLWVYVTNVENNIRSTEISNIPVEIINSDALKDSKLALSPNQDLSVNLKVEGNNSDINKIKKSDFKVQVDMSEYVWKKGDNRVPVSIVDYPITVNVKNTNTLTVLIKIEDLVEKDMNVESDIKVTPEDGYYVSTPVINPNQVKISGAESSVNSVSKLVVQDDKVGVNSDFTGDYKIKALDSEGKEVLGVSLSTETASVDVKVSKGKQAKINLQISGALPEGLKLKNTELSREYVEILGDKGTIDGISEVKTEPLDLSSIKESKEVTLKVIQPDGVKIAQGEEVVKVKLNVIKYTSKEFTVPYNIKGNQPGLKITASKDKVKMIVSGYENDLKSLTDGNIKAYLDIADISKEGSYDKTPTIEFEGTTGSYEVTSVESVNIIATKEEPSQGSTDTSTNNNSGNNTDNSSNGTTSGNGNSGAN